MTVRRPIRFVLAAALVLTGCSALIGVNDIFLDPNAGAAEGGLPEGSTTDGPITSTEGGAEAAVCAGDLQTDKKNCGRCGHDCLGGNCTTGKCQVIALGGSLAAPAGIALDATHVYAANSGDGTVVRIPKGGGNVEKLVSGWGSSLNGIAVAGTTLFWSSDTGFGDGGGGSFGGLWMCTLPACTTKKNISAAGYVRHLDAKNGFVYYATQDDVRRVKVDGTGDMTIATVNQAFSVAADTTHVYYTSNQNSLARAPIVGGPGEDVGPLNAKFTGFVSVDSQHFYWAFTDLADKGQVYGGLKSATATRMSYGNANQGSIAAVGDDTNVYWLNDGTVTGNESNGDGVLLTCPMAGCAADPVQLVDKLHFGGPIISEGNALYFIEFGGRSGANGRILKIAKP